MLVSFPSAATFWVTYETAKKVVNPIAESMHVGGLGPAVAGGIAEFAVVIVRNPFEVSTAS